MCIRVVSRVAERLKTYDLRKYHENLEASQNYSLVLSLPPKMKTLSVLLKIPAKKIELSRSALFHMKTRASFKYFVHDCNNVVSFTIRDFIKGSIKLLNHKCYLKLVSAIFYQIFIFSPNDSPSKTMKNVFYFI